MYNLPNFYFIYKSSTKEPHPKYIREAVIFFLCLAFFLLFSSSHTTSRMICLRRIFRLQFYGFELEFIRKTKYLRWKVWKKILYYFFESVNIYRAGAETKALCFH